jgi:hypothetical protein
MLDIINIKNRYVVTCDMLGYLASFKSKIIAIDFIKTENKRPF